LPPRLPGWMRPGRTRRSSSCLITIPCLDRIWCDGGRMIEIAQLFAGSASRGCW
jgi:hypothetical protein